MTQYGWRDGKITVKKFTVQDKMPVNYAIPDLAGQSTVAILEAFDLGAHGTANITGTSLSAQPPYPMAISVQAINDGTAANTDTLTIYGYDARGNFINEAVTVSSTAQTGNTVSSTNNAFARITKMVANAVSGSSDLNVGYVGRIGLPYKLNSFDDIISYGYGSAYSTTNASTMTLSSTYHTLTLPAMEVGKSVKLLWLSKVQ